MKKYYHFLNILYLTFSVVGVLYLLICVGCNLADSSGSFMNLQIEDTSLIFLCYSGDGKITETTIEKGSEAFKYLQHWFNKNQTGWKKSHITFAPKYEIRASSFTLNIRSDILVLEYKIKIHKWRQFVKDTPEGFLDNIMSRSFEVRVPKKVQG